MITQNHDNLHHNNSKNVILYQLTTSHLNTVNAFKRYELV